MTQNPETILKGLNCCSKSNPLCEDCPYNNKDMQCRELESDASDLIKSLQSTVETQSEMIDRLGHDIDIKLNYIYTLEERLGIAHE